MTALRSVSPELEKPSASIVYVTPEMAERFLALNLKNRRLKDRKISQYARDMAAGAWLITGEAIKFDTNGHLIDGQNRLSAVVASGVTVPLFVVRGLAPETQKVMDSGTPRSAADGLNLDGFADGKDIAATVRVLMAWDAGFYRTCMHQMNPTYTNSEVYDFVEQNPDTVDVVRWMKPVQRELRLPIGALGASAYKFRELDADTAADFFDRIRELRTNGKGDPIQTLLKRVADERMVKHLVRPPLALYLVVRAWNAYRNHDQMTKFQIGSEKSGWAQIPKPI